MSRISRKAFLKGAAAGMAGLALMGGYSMAAEGADFPSSIPWDAEYDVVVLGLGMAGGSAAIAAADAGARVLVAEKAGRYEAGGNSKYAGQGFVYVQPENRDGAVAYFKRIRGKYNTPEDDVLEAFTDMIVTSRDWVAEHGGNAAHQSSGIGEFRDIEGWDLMDCWSIDGSTWDGKMYNFLVEYCLNNENIDVWYEAPAEDFIQDPETKTVHGVRLSVDGAQYNVRAKNGVILCTGGFENNIQMIQDFHQLPYAYSKGALYNTGDGIKMAQRIGAELWHMGNIAGPDLNAINPLLGRSYGYANIGKHGLKSMSVGFSLGSVILVGADGTRFANEAVMPGHGFIDFHGMKLRQPVSLPAYVVFDQAAFETTIYYCWDNQAMVDSGTILKADSLDELSSALGLPEGSLSATVSRYNRYCAQGEDEQLGRDPEYLIPLSEEGPYYAYEVVPTYTNTQGGPRRNAQGQVMDTQGQPIPHLYSAGECGSIWGDIYQGAGNLAECLAFGRISGANAAEVKEDGVQESLLAGQAVNFSWADGEITIETGENQYGAVVNGLGGAMAVRTTFADGKIQAVEVLSHHETIGVGTMAIDRLPARIVEANSVEVDVIAGATSSSRAILEAVSQCLAQAE